MAFKNFKSSYCSKLGFYIVVLFAPVLFMTLVEVLAPDSPLSVTGGDSSKFLFFLVYFLPGLIMAWRSTDSLRRTLGVGIAYIILSPAYYLYAAQWACRFGSAGCIDI